MQFLLLFCHIPYFYSSTVLLDVSTPHQIWEQSGCQSLIISIRLSRLMVLHNISNNVSLTERKAHVFRAQGHADSCVTVHTCGRHLCSHLWRESVTLSRFRQQSSHCVCFFFTLWQHKHTNMHVWDTPWRFMQN